MRQPKWFNINDAATQNGMFAYVNKFEKKPYPSIDGRVLRFELDRGTGQARLPRQPEVISNRWFTRRPVSAGNAPAIGAGKIRHRPRSGGLLNCYDRVA
jgi:hypothetical protein